MKNDDASEFINGILIISGVGCIFDAILALFGKAGAILVFGVLLVLLGHIDAFPPAIRLRRVWRALRIIMSLAVSLALGVGVAMIAGWK